jgi:hypothetical protein
LPLGLRRRGEEQSRQWELRPGTLAVLYTDGLTESTRSYTVGEDRFRRASETKGLADAEDPARTIFDAILFDGAHDDVAILTLRLPDSAPRAGNDEWAFDSSDRERAGEIRRLIAQVLADRGASK